MSIRSRKRVATPLFDAFMDRFMEKRPRLGDDADVVQVVNDVDLHESSDPDEIADVVEKTQVFIGNFAVGYRSDAWNELIVSLRGVRTLTEKAHTRLVVVIDGVEHELDDLAFRVRTKETS